jgi:tyrosyl-tRNA synthetase
VSREKLTDPKLTPQLLKSSLAAALNELLAPIRADFAASKEWQAIETQAYPPPVVEVKVKKAKDKGDPAKRAAAAEARKKAAEAGGSEVVAKPDGHVEGKDAEAVTLGGSPEEILKKLHVDS